MLAVFATVGLTQVQANDTDDKSAPRPLASVEELAALPQYAVPQLSDSGRFIAAFTAVKTQRILVVDRIDGTEAKPFLVAGDDWRLNRFEWLADDRLLLYVSIPQFYAGTPITVTRLVLVDPMRREMDLMFKRVKKIGGYQIQTNVLSTLPDDPDHILVDLNLNDAAKALARRASLKTKNLVRGFEQRSLPGIRAFRADATGRVRVGYGVSGDQKRAVLKMQNADDEWIDHSAFGNRAGFRVLGLPADQPDVVYVNSEHEHPLGALYTFDVNSGAFLRKLAQHDESEISAIHLSRDGTRLESVLFASEAVANLHLDDWTARFEQTLQKLLPDTHNAVVSVTPDRSMALVRASASDVDPHFYLYRRDKQSLAFIASEYPTLGKRSLAATRVQSFKARDGLSIAAYVTLPATARSDAPGAFVVLPHGGPHSRNFLRYDWLVQTLASQGYGVLQLNFRGSTGYGSAHMLAGSRQWGQAMQDDITDGTRWLIEQGLADPDRICIAGGSYGGYAALMGVVKEPDLYQCAISLNGVSDLPRLLRLQNQFIGGRYLTRHIGRLWRDRAALRDNSPARQAANIQVPVLLVHGSDDRVVSVRQSRRMARSLAAADVDHDFLELPDGDHYLSRGDNRLAFARRAVAFLERSLSAPAAVPVVLPGN